MLFVSTRQRFRQGDPGWDGYIAWIGLTIEEVRTIDAKLNKYVDECGDLYCAPSEVETVIEMLPKPSNDREYTLLAAAVGSEGCPEELAGFELLGCDLSDETITSSVVNCGPWRGLLAPFVQRINSYGLLSVADAREAQKLLPQEWGDNPHASATIWAVFAKRP
jgi:hypothetical protein